MGLFDSGDSEQNNESTAGFSPADEISGGGGGAMKRVIDEEAGVVIYAVDSGNSYAMSAVPIEDTDLEIEE